MFGDRNGYEWRCFIFILTWSTRILSVDTSTTLCPSSKENNPNDKVKYIITIFYKRISHGTTFISVSYNS